MTRNQRLTTVVGSAAVIAAVTLLTRIAGFGRSLAFSGAVGTGCVGQAYTTANLLPNVLFEVAAGGTLASAVVPLVATARSGERTGDQVDRVAGGLLGWVLVVLTPVSLALALLAVPLSRLLPAETCSGQRELAAAMIAVFAPQVVLYGLGAVLTGLLQAHERFVGPAVAPLLSSLVVVVAYLGYGQATRGLSDGSTEVHPAALQWLAVGTTLGVLVMTVPLLVPVRRAGVTVRPTLRLPPGVAGQGRRLAAAGTLGLLGQQAFVLATLVLADLRGDTTSITVLGYAQTLQLLPYAVLVVPLVTTTYPLLARAARRDTAAFAQLAATTTNGVIALSTIGAAAVLAVAPAAAAFYADLDRQRSPGLEPALSALAVGVLGWGLLTHLTRVLYAADAAGRAARATAGGWAAGVAAAVLLVVVGERAGQQAATSLAQAGSVATLTAGIALLLAVRRAVGVAAVRGAWQALALAPAVLLVTGLLGRAAGSQVLSWTAGTPRTGAVVAAVAAAAVAVPAAALASWLLDPNALRHIRHPATGDGPPSVLLVVATTTGGTGRHVGALAAGLVAAGRRVVLAAPDSAWRALDSGGAPVGAQRLVLPVAERPHLWNDLRALHRLQVAAGQVDVVHAHGLRAAALACLVRQGAPVVATLHNAPPRGGVAGLLSGGMERVVARRAGAVLVVSSDLGDRMRALGAERVERALIPAPAPRPVEAGHAAGLRADVAPSPAGPELPLLVTVARLAPQKDVDLLLSTVAELRARGVEVLAVVVGDGPLRASLASRIDQEHLPVRLVGHRDDAAAWLSAADVVVVPSRWEGQPLVVQEALRLGAAVVATDAGGTRDVTGPGAVLVPPGDPRAMADALQVLLSDPPARQDLQVRARAAAQRLPDDAAALDQVRRLYDTLTAVADAQGSAVAAGR